MKFAEFVASLPPVGRGAVRKDLEARRAIRSGGSGARDLLGTTRGRTTAERLVAQAERALRTELDVGAAAWPDLVARFSRFGGDQWRELRRTTQELVPEARKAPAAEG